jgi:hypothetical protein
MVCDVRSKQSRAPLTRSCWLCLGYSVDTDSLHNAPHWRLLFSNTNDNSVEGIRHCSMPLVGVQFHPEGHSGPVDSSFIFDWFVQQCTAHATGNVGISVHEYLQAKFHRLALPCSSATTTLRLPVKSVLILGSGGLRIGQAGEFDYSGSQALKALRQCNVAVCRANM